MQIWQELSPLQTFCKINQFNANHVDKNKELKRDNRLLLCLEEDISLQTMESQARQTQGIRQPERLDLQLMFQTGY